MNQLYDNFFLTNEIEDQFNSHLDLMQFATVDNNLVGTAGMIRKINRYSATDSVEKVAMGEGNDGASESRLVPYEYEIECAQGRFGWYDEEAKIDPIAVQAGITHIGTDMFNTVNGDLYGEFLKAEIVVPVTTFNFDAFADAQSMFGFEDSTTEPTFSFVAPSDVAGLRKTLKDDLKYVEAFARAGYVGTVAGTNIYTKKDATPGVIPVATKSAVTIFNKTGVEGEPERDANTRHNYQYGRKYYVVALTDATKDVLIMKGTATLSTDTTVEAGKTYYAQSGLGYVAVVPAEGDNPTTKGWYEIA